MRAGRCGGSTPTVLAPPSSRAIGGDAAARRPSSRPIALATAHQPSAIVAVPGSPAARALSSVIAASVVAAAAHSSTVVLTKSANGISAQQDLEQLADAARAVDHRIGRRLELLRRLLGAHADAHRALADHRAQGPLKASTSVRSSPTYRAAAGGSSASSQRMPRPLSIGTGGRISSTLRPRWVSSPASSAASSSAATATSAAPSSGAPRQWKATIAPLSSRRTRSC